MRRTDVEFKAEVFRRTEEYRARRKRRRKIIAAICLPVVLCSGAVMAVFSIGYGGSATESVYDNAMSAEYIEAPAAAAPESVEEEAGIWSADAAEPAEGMEQNSSGSVCCAAVQSITVVSQPEMPEYARVFTDPVKTAAIMDAIQAFLDDSDTVTGGDEVGAYEGTAFRITVTEEVLVREYVLFNEALLTDGIWYVNPECYQALEKLILQKGD